jgi:hypothetical protein
VAISKQIQRKNQGSVSAFVKKARAIKQFAGAQSRLIFAMDATASRQPTWDYASQLHHTLFDAAAEDKSLSLQLCFFRGLGEFSASAWLNDPDSLKTQLSSVYCVGGATQIATLLRHYLYEGSQSHALKALVFIGDAVEEPLDELRGLAIQCRLKELPILLFQEGRDARASQAFKLMATVSGGAHLQFDDASSGKLRDLLRAAVKFTTGGRKALQDSISEGDRLLLKQVK